MVDLTKSGYIYKWTNYVKGYKKRWFVLQDGYLSYYRNQKEMSHTCRGTIHIATATIQVTDNLHFVISSSASQTFHLRSISDSEQKKWLETLEVAKKKAQSFQKDAGNSDIENQEPEKQAEYWLNELSQTLSTLKKCQDTLNKKCEDFSRAIAETDFSVTNLLTTTPPASSNASGVTMTSGSTGVGGGGSVGTGTSIGGGNSTTSGGTILSVDPTLLYNVEKSRFAGLSERANITKISARALIKASNDYHAFAEITVKKLKLLFEQDKERLRSLEQMVEDLAKQHSNLEKRVRHSQLEPDEEEEEEEGSADRLMASESAQDSSEDSFYDAGEVWSDSVVGNVVGTTSAGAGGGGGTNASSTAVVGLTDKKDRDQEIVEQEIKLTNEDEYVNEYESDVENDSIMGYREPPTARTSNALLLPEQAAVNRRKAKLRNRSVSPATSAVDIPVRSSIKRRTEIPPKPKISINLWSIVKNCIGKDLSRIPMPVNFSEPLSMLQRLTEDFEYSSCLDKAANSLDSIEAMAFVAAFTVSSYASTLHRVNKPFNPLLGETYECDRTDDLGWRSVAEQVSHHPPVAALHCESRAWYCWQDFTMATKFRGKYLQIEPLGSAHLILRHNGHHYVWRKVQSTVHNIIVGKLWIDNSGDMEIINYTTGETCRLSFKAYSYFSNDVPRRVTGTIHNADGKIVYVLNGTWDSHMNGMKMNGSGATVDSVINAAATATTTTSSSGSQTSSCTRLWTVTPLPPNAEPMYNFTPFTLTLNQLEPGVAPTDSRLRPDQRLMEDGRWDEANQEKLRLESKQRERRKKLSDKANEDEDVDNHRPIWFTDHVDTDSGIKTCKFTGLYWKHKEVQDWSICPSIF